MSSDGEQVICHHPKDHKPGDVIDGWAFTGNTSDGRAGHFVRDQPQPNWQPQKQRTGATHLAVPIKGPVQLLRIAPSPSQPDSRSVRQQPDVSSYKNWRDYLIHLEGFPLIPVGAGPKGKAPIDPTTGKEASNWQANPQTPEQIAAMDGVVSCVGSLSGPQADHTLYIDIDGAACIERCKQHGCTTKDLGWTIRRTTSNDRLKVPFYIPPDLQHFLQDDNGNPIGKRVLTVKPAVYDLDPDGTPKRDSNGRLVTLEPAQQIELFYGTGQCILLGEHKESGGHYYWTGSPIQMATPTPEWWGLITAVLEANAAESKAARKHAKGSGSTKQSGPHHACRICGRNTSPACTEYSDGERVRINCFEGQTFQPPTGHGLKSGHTVTIGATTWGFCGHGFNPAIGGFSTFVEHIERPKPSEPVAEPSGAAQGTPFKGTDWIRDQLQECLEAGLSTGQMATEVIRIAADADVYPATVKDLLAGLRADEQDAEDAADIADLIQQVSAAEQAINAIRLQDYLPPKLTAALQTFQRGIPYTDTTLLMAQLVQVSATLKLGTRINGNPFTDWELPLNLYGIDVGPSGARKSPLVKALFTKPAEQIRAEINQLNSQRFEAWEKECSERKQNKPPKPIPLVHSTNEYTGEALAERLALHEIHKYPMLVLREEIAALFDSFGKYKQGGKGTGGDEQQLLEIFDGDGFNSLRIGGGRGYDKCHVSLYGGIQDDVLRRLIASGDANGKWARCIFVPLPEMTYQLSRPTEADRIDRRMAEFDLKQLSTDLFKQSPRVFELDGDGIDMLLQYDHLCQRQRDEASINAVKALKNKSPGKALRIAGLLHVLRCHELGKFTIDVPCTRLAEAIALVDALDAWAASFHATAALSAANAHAVANREHLLQRIHDIASKSKGTVPWSTIRRSLKSTEKKGITVAMAKVMLQTLHDRACGQLSTGKRGGLSYRVLGPFA